MDWGALAAITGPLGLRARRAASVIAELVGEDGIGGRVLVVGDDLAKALRQRGVVVEGIPLPKNKQAPLALAVETGSVDVACIAGLPADPAAALVELGRVVRHGGLVALAAPASTLRPKAPLAEALAAAFVHARLIHVEQRQHGALLVCAGSVRRPYPTTASAPAR